MNILKTVSRLATVCVPGKERRKKARLRTEDFLNLLLHTEKYVCTRNFERCLAVNTALPREKFHIISLGTNCFVRMTLNLWGLKPRKAEGELSMPFDLAVHPLSVVIKYLKNRFDGYFDEIEFDEENGYWVNRKDGIKFIHERNDDRDFFIARYEKRIANLLSALADDKPCLLVCHDSGEVNGKEVDELYQLLQTFCGHKKFKLIMAVFNGTVSSCNENVIVYTDNFPYEGYLYMDKKVKFTKAGYGFEEPFVRLCRKEVIKLTGGKNA